MSDTPAWMLEAAKQINKMIDELGSLDDNEVAAIIASCAPKPLPVSGEGATPDERCFDCNNPLSECGDPNPDGTLSMDCKVCQLRDMLATERAAREEAHAALASVPAETKRGMGLEDELAAVLREVQEDDLATAMPSWRERVSVVLARYDAERPTP